MKVLNVLYQIRIILKQIYVFMISVLNENEKKKVKREI